MGHFHTTANVLSHCTQWETLKHPSGLMNGKTETPMVIVSPTFSTFYSQVDQMGLGCSPVVLPRHSGRQSPASKTKQEHQPTNKPNKRTD